MEMEGKMLSKFLLGLALSFLVNCPYSAGQKLVPILDKVGFSGKDVTPLTFGHHNKEVFPVAYADFNSDKITDIFTLTRDYSTLSIFFGQETPSPLFKPQIECNLQENWEILGFSGENTPVKIVGVVPADFTGDSILDVMITYKRERLQGGDKTLDASCDSNGNVTGGLEVVIFRGNLTSLDCSVLVDRTDVIMDLVDEPLALDINGDMVMDLFGEVWKCTWPMENITMANITANATNTNCTLGIEKRIWVFEPVVGVESPVRPPIQKEFNVTSSPHAHDRQETVNCSKPHLNSFADINGDLVPELVLVTSKKSPDGGWQHQRKTYRIDLETPGEPKFRLLYNPVEINTPTESPPAHPHVLGQPIYMDLNQESRLLHLFPFTTQNHCKGTNGILVVTENGTSILPIEFSESTGKQWKYPCLKHGDSTSHSNYSQTIVLRAGDFNLDGFPDLIGILRPPVGDSPMNSRAVLFENVPCTPTALVSCPYPRTFRINFDALAQYRNVTLATFFDLHEDGLVDVVLVRKTNDDPKPNADTYAVFAFENSPDYDANFMKVMVLSGRSCPLCPQSQTPYGNIISGPVIGYSTTTQADHFQTATAAQFYRSAHLPLDLPYTIFGLGPSPNFIETLDISVSTDPLVPKKSSWPQLIPNSQIIIIPSPIDKPWQWSAKLFLTPSRAVLNTGLVLIGFCTIICLIIGGLQYKERRDDMKERLQEAHRFHMF